jgi:chromosomal replication initiator protein
MWADIFRQTVPPRKARTPVPACADFRLLSGHGHLVSFAEIRYNAGFQKQDGTDMVDGIVDIPLPGQPLWSDREDDARVAPCHFLAGPENRLVEEAVRSVVNEPPNGYNPLVLFGPSGTGKSHLARGLAAVCKSPDRRHRAIYCTAVEFAQELAEAIETQAVEEFRAKYRKAALLVFEDLGHLATRKAGKLSAQEEFIHTLDALLAEEHWVIVTASAAPAELPGILPALQSRLVAGLTIPLSPPGPKTRLAVLQQLAALKNVHLPEPAAHVLAEGLAGTVPELAGALLQLMMHARLGNDEIDLPAVKRYLARHKRSRHPTLHEIALATARHFSLKLADLRSPVRRRALVTARGVAVYLARHLTGDSLEEIGSYFGGRDHTTVIHSCRKTEEMLESDPAIREAVDDLQKELWKT